MPDEEENFSSLPLQDRFAHKNWKVRKEAYEDAKQRFEKTADESDSVFAQFVQDPGLWKGAVADSNVAAQQEGLASYCSFLKYAGVQACIKTRGYTVPSVVEKGLTQTRPAAKASALEVLLLCVEVDKADPVIQELIPVLSHKVPKVAAATLAALTAIYHNFGCKLVDPKPVLKVLPKAFAHADKNVRSEAQNLAVELYRWLKDAIKPLFFSDLKPVQQQDLDKLFEAIKEEPSPRQERLTRAQADAMMSVSADPAENDDEGLDGEGVEEDADEVDVFDLAEPVDVMQKIPKNFHEQISSSKWKDRKETLDALYSVLSVPRIKEGPFDEVVRALAKAMKDANVAVVTVAANCVDLLARGLRSEFAKYRSAVLSSMLERLKEKKQSVADALGQALDAVFASTQMSDCLEEIFEFLKHKNPQVKQETLKFLIRCLRSTRDVPTKTEVKSIAEAATKLMTESSEVIRSGGAEMLGTLMKIMGERAMNPYLEGLDDIRKAKIKEYFETAVVKAKDRPKPIVGPSKTAPGLAGKKPTAVKRPALGSKSSTAATVFPAEEPVLASPQPKLTSKVGRLKPGGLPKPGSLPLSDTAPKLQRKLAGPVSARSPQRRAASPPPEEQAQRPPPGPKFGAGRSLAGRPILKPTLPAESALPPVATQSTGISATERAELEELRLEKELFVRTVEELRSEKAKLSSQIAELQNQNAQLIEDHTRDVLSIKAKETQLVRARSDAETAEETVQKQQREIERLKRELARVLRANAVSSPAAVSDNVNIPGVDTGSVYQDMGGNGYSLSRAGLHLGTRLESNLPRSYVSASPTEEKENNGAESPSNSSRDDGLGRRKLTPTFANNYTGVASPSRSSGLGSSNGDEKSLEPAENWKRAAEVTSQLKARIEHMKARQGLYRPQGQR